MLRKLTQGEREALFWRYVDKTGTDEDCWQWLGCTYKGGYGRFWDGEKRVAAHKYVYEMVNHVTVEEGLGVLHRCDNPGCVNPNHLWVGTQADNMFDASKKGRWRNQKNGHARAAKLAYKGTQTGGN